MIDALAALAQTNPRLRTIDALAPLAQAQPRLRLGAQLLMVAMVAVRQRALRLWMIRCALAALLVTPLADASEAPNRHILTWPTLRCRGNWRKYETG